MGLGNRVAAAVFLAAVLCSSPALAASTASTSHPLIPARLEGAFRLAGQVTVATNVAGERVGDSVKRTWTFKPACQTGQCSSVSLVRARAHGQDKLKLGRVANGFYVGTGTFYAPLRCGTQTYPNGQRVPFKITVRVMAAQTISGALRATQVKAFYTNDHRVNTTPCFALLGHDAAFYRGHLVSPAPKSGGGGLSGRSPAGS
jgi:hypothetical protein